MISPRGKVFRDPVHGLIRIEPGDEFVLALINTPEFQRLRRVRQLGVSSLTFPGAEHTRFAQRIVANLLRRSAKQDWPPCSPPNAALFWQPPCCTMSVTGRSHT